jgi:hypothetical protein
VERGLLDLSGAENGALRWVRVDETQGGELQGCEVEMEDGRGRITVEPGMHLERCLRCSGEVGIGTICPRGWGWRPCRTP